MQLKECECGEYVDVTIAAGGKVLTLCRVCALKLIQETTVALLVAEPERLPLPPGESLP